MVTEKHAFEHRDKSIVLNIFELSDYRNYDGRISSNDFSIESYSAKVKLSITTLMEKIKFIVIANKEFEYR